MRTYSRSGDRLAVLGGTPVFARLPILKWPPTSKATERALVEIYRSRALSWNGPWEQRFCRDFARVHTARHCVFMANGTVTLEAALHVLGVGPGDEVIVPALTWLATAMAVTYNGAKPVFVDIEPDTLCLDPDRAAEAITPRTKAIIPVHLYGGMADMDRIRALARKRGLKVIEDCAHAHGGQWNGRGLGSLGDIGSFSFQQSKTVACGEGGAVITNSPRLMERLFRFKHIGYTLGAKQGKAQAGPPPGLRCHNYRGTELPAAILHGQLGDLVARTRQRNRNADFLTRELEKIPGVKVQARGRRCTTGRQSYYAFMTILELEAWNGATIEQIIRALGRENVPAWRSYNSVYRHSLWNEPPQTYRIHGGYRDKHGPGCKVSEEIGWGRVVGCAHSYLDLPRRDLAKIVEAFAKVQRHSHRLRKLR
jgi:L-glutamine:2-deoxy-scyllo-inosose/3-amino-2,3-dideoxy-scyllo-inosose aminotransferase